MFPIIALVCLSSQLTSRVLTHHDVASTGPVPVSLVVFGQIALLARGPGTLQASGPVYQTAAGYIGGLYNGSLVINYVLTPAYPCLLTISKAEDDLASWYNRLQTPGRVMVFLTPGIGDSECDAYDYSVYRLASNWNTLILNTIGGVEMSAQNAVSTALSLGSVNNPSFVNLALKLITKYDWGSIFIVLDRTSVPVYRSLAVNLAAGIATDRRAHTLYQVASDANTTFQAALLEFCSVSRVMFFFGHAAKLRKLLLTAYTLNMTNGEYIYFATEVMRAPSLYGNLRWQYGDKYDEVARLAFRSLLVLEPFIHQVHSPAALALASDFRRGSFLSYNTTYPPGNDQLTALMGSYTAVLLLGQVLHEAWKSGRSLADGRSLKLAFLNRTFHTDFGDIFVDSSGMRKESLAVTYFTSDVREPFIVQYANANILTMLKEDIKWPKYNWPPPSEPTCGFHGEKGNCYLTNTGGLFYGLLTGCGLSVVFFGVAALRWLTKRVIKSEWSLDLKDFQQTSTSGLLTIRNKSCSSSIRSLLM